LSLQQDVAALSIQVDKTTTMYQTLLVEFPDAADHMTAKHDELMAEWNSLLAKAELRRHRLQQAESVQLYFDDYRGLWYESFRPFSTASRNNLNRIDTSNDRA